MGNTNAAIVIPGSVFYAVNHETVAAVVFPAQDACERLTGIFCDPGGIRAVPWIKGGNDVHPALGGVGAVPQEIVDHLLGNGRSEGRSLCALRFLDDL